MKRMDRRALFSSGVAAALLAASGVSAMPEAGGRLRAALSGASRADGWDVVGGLFSQAAHASVFEGLTEIAADGTVRGEIAERWHSDAEGRDWCFHLRKTVFHDGLPLDQADVAMAFGAFGTVAFDGATLSLSLDEPDQNLPYRLAAPEHLVRPADAARRAAGVGSGLYRVRKFDAGRHFIAERVARHWRDGQAGWFDEVEFVHFDDAGVRLQALREGLVDVADVDDQTADTGNFVRLPDATLTRQVVSRALGVPTQTGRLYALDNLRMAERWWRS
jgi:ABC-type transport system substrate-binding protein